MTKEKITLEGVRQDLHRIIKWQLLNKFYWRACFIWPITLIAILLGFGFRRLWIGMIVFSVAAYHILCYVSAYKEYLGKKRVLKNYFKRDDISISVKKLSHIAEITIYEPYMGYRRVHTTKIVKMYFFNASMSWRNPNFRDHYQWSKDLSISSRGLDNISLIGDEFFYVSLQKYKDIAYIYPCKYFELDSDLKK